MAHIVLLGDSILDNGAYVVPGEDVSSRLKERLPNDRVTLLARDGAVIDGALEQLTGVPSDATHLVISAGGNDALRSVGVLGEPARTVADALGRVLIIRDRFADRYRKLLDGAQRFDPPTAICTIYDVRLPDLQQRALANLALGVLNDVITREAASRRLALIDLRVMFTSEAHFANAIEPSGHGSELIAAAIQDVVASHGTGPSVMYTGL
jgi:hypothetical protein